MPLLKKLFRSMLEKKAQYISAWLLVVISSMVFYSCTVAGANLIDNLNHFFNTHHVEDAQFVVEKPLENVSTIDKKFDTQIEERYSADITLKDKSVLRLLAATDSIDQYSVIKGTKLANEHDILVDPGYAKAHHLTIGGTLTLNGETFHIKGTMAVPDYIYPLKSVSGFLKNPKAFGVAVVNKNVIRQWQITQTYYSVQLNQNNKDALKNHLNQSNHVLQWIGKNENNRISFIKGDIEAIKKTGETLPFGILLITIVIILILLWRLLKQEYVQIGTLNALGYNKKEIMRHYLGYAVVLAISGSIVGTILGWFVLHPLLLMYAAFYNLPVLIVKPHVSYLMISLLLPMVFFIPLTYLLVRRVLKIPPVILMKGGELKTKVNALERAFHMRSLKFSTRFTIREVLRGLPRVVFLTIGVMFSTVLILLGFVTMDSMNYLVKDNFQNVYHYEYDYVFNQIQTKPPTTGQIASAAPVTLQNKNQKSAIIYGLKSDNTAIHLTDSHGKVLSFDSVTINRSLADKLKIHPGDRLSIKNKLNNQTYTVTIDHIAQSFLGDIIYMPLDTFNKINGYPKGSYTELYANQKLTINPNILMSTTHTAGTIDAYKQMIKPLNYGVGAIAVASGVIAVIIIYILISLMIEENSFKISLMKVIGYDDRMIRKLMINVNIWFVIIGFLIGIPVTLASTGAFLNSITAEMNLSFPVKVDWINIVISFVILLAAYYLSLLMNRKKLKQISMHEAINKSTE